MNEERLMLNVDNNDEVNLHITTLYAACEEQAMVKALDIYVEEKTLDKNITENRFYELVEQLMPTVAEREYVHVKDGVIEICVDRDQIDNKAVEYALSFLPDMELLTVGKRLEFGYNKSFGYRGM